MFKVKYNNNKSEKKFSDYNRALEFYQDKLADGDISVNIPK